MRFVGYDVCHIMTFVANYDVWHLYCLSQYHNLRLLTLLLTLIQYNLYKFSFSKSHRDLKINNLFSKVGKNLPFTSKNYCQKENPK